MTEKASVFDVAKWFLDKEDISPKRLRERFDLIQKWKEEFERLRPNLKAYGKYVPQGLKLAFVGNETTNWTIYADTLVPLEEKATEKPASNPSKTTTTQLDKEKVK